MYVFAYALQLMTLLCAIAGSGFAILQLLEGRDSALRVVEKAHWAVSGTLLLASALLLHALFWKDYSLQYVASYTDNVLPTFYRLTAFWAGQAGSMLFWALSVAVMGSIFALTPAYARLTSSTRLWFWAFFHGTMAFFALILTTWSNPFMMQTPTPPDGGGLNPLLQNPGMIFHPPLLFLGYGGFAVPSCLALAQAMSGGRGLEDAWFRAGRPFLLTAWILLTAGIVLGMWWAYMELGWGGYWAWDPVENASLLPWLIGGAVVHTAVIEDRRGKLSRVNVLLMGLCTVSAFFATWLVRSGVIQSVHAFGDGGVGVPLLIFVLASGAVSVWAACCERRRGEAMEGILTCREGMLLPAAWILLALTVIILLATMWPVLSALWSPSPAGLDARFYNRVCLPLSVLLLGLMLFCPWIGWKGGLTDRRALLTAGGTGLAGAIILLWWLSGRDEPLSSVLSQPLPILATILSVGVLASCAIMGVRAARGGSLRTLGVVGAHAGLALMALGVAISGPYKLEKDLVLAKQGANDSIGGYVITLTELKEGREPGYDFIEARLRVERDGALVGMIGPQRRIYEKFGSSQFSEVDVIPSFGQEIYASLLGLDDRSNVHVRVSVEPGINWLWLGGVIMCLLPFLALCRRRTKAAE